MDILSQNDLFEPDIVIPRKAAKKVSPLHSSDEEPPAEVTQCAQSTPLNPEPLMFENMKKKINMKIEEHKSSLKRLRDEEKANNEEWLRILNSVVKGREPDSDNSTEHPPIMWGGDNLMEIFAGPEPSKFGRKIAVSLFGGRETSLFKDPYHWSCQK